MRVLYFTVVPIGGDNGGSICCRNHIRRLSEDPNIELFAIIAGQSEWRGGAEEFLKPMQVPHHFIPFRAGNFHHENNSLRSLASFLTKAAFQIPWEVLSLNQPQIQEALDWAITAWKIDTLVIEYHASALFFDLPRRDVRTAIIKMNREADFYRQQIQMGLTHHGSLTRGISLRRAAQFEKRVDSSIGKVIVIGPPDLPNHETRSGPVCITPYLDLKPEPWRYSASRQAFFIGSIHHYPNRLAIEWIATRLAPEVRSIGSDIRISIVGATTEEVPEAWHGQNLDYLGKADAETVERLFRGADLMICPVRNDFGVKFKAAEALAYGTPMFASEQTLLGFPHLRNMPAIALDEPVRAANELCVLTEHPGILKGLSASQLEQQTAFIATQGNIWSKVLQDIPPYDQLKEADSLAQF